ncbi:TonB-dependent receptor [Reichenbachiella agariperforans]|uniref:TonB-dependent receptor n=1 Tax=Reichenbachiella agariperforans TaxID=156994 RepID=UPI001C0826BA|nr:TonB-dependent receptor [Reichenbachiella agariperforans]MBU2914499.1 TonB-dependent receptor [Reichenbachiella agariperforans]
MIIKITERLFLSSENQISSYVRALLRFGVLLFLSISIFSVSHAQESSMIIGTVLDQNKEAVLGAAVVIKGTSLGTVTDMDGKFSIQAKEGDVFTVSFVGYTDETFEVVGGETEYTITLEENATELGMVYVVGSRNANRSELNSAVPVDVLDVSELSANTGRVEINQILQYAAPSFNATKQSGSDGADHVDPASLRGLGPDQTLVLVNGKRRHQSSLVNIFGTRGRGNSGTDLNAIPASSIKRVEILRDGASAQYGSDAIAGVINIVLKDQTEGVTGGVTYGAYSTNVGGDYEQKIFDTQDGWETLIYNVNGKNRLDGEEKSFDGNTMKIDLNYGMKIGDKGGYANITTEYLTKDRTLRPSYEWRKGYGTAGVDGFNFMVNTAVPITNSIEFYAYGGRNYRDTDAYAFSRDSFDDGDNRSVPSLYPNGFTPRITSVITDVSATAGVRYDMDNGWKVDFFNNYGKNNFHYLIKDSNNASLGAASPTEFDAGGHSLSMNTTGIDFTKYFEDIASGLNIAYGLEYRTEQFEIFAGEQASYGIYDQNGTFISIPAEQTPAVDSNGDQLPGGSQGFPGYSPSNEVDKGRTNFGIYVDAELNIIEDLSVSGALRFEEYSDFGETFNYKLAARYEILDGLAVRASASSGFRAPSLAQIHYNLLFNNIVAGTSIRTLLASNTSTVTRAFGIEPLKQETAQNYSVGITYEKGDFTATVDAYSISVDDRIILTDNFDASSLNVGAEAAQFFANGVDTKTEGVDIVLSYRMELGAKGNFQVGLIGNINELTIEEIHNGDLNEYTFFGPFSQAYLKAAAPDYKFGLNLNYSSPKLTASVNLTQFSEVQLQDFQWVDSPPTTDTEAEALYAVATDTYEAIMTVDMSVGYNITEGIKFTIGGNNILNKYPTPQFDGWTDQGGFNDSVQMGSDGAYFFGRLNFTF